jgi:SAM-dependent methyltransferase
MNSRDVKSLLSNPLLAFPRNVISRMRYGGRATRCLEIGPGKRRIQGFETLNIVAGWNVDYVCDAARHLPFPDGTFDIVYASHILEHVPWYQTERVLSDWARVLKPGGKLEVWVPDGLKICEAFVAAELNGSERFLEDGWFRFNEGKDPCRWAAGRVFTYGDGSGRTDHPNWHRALFSARYLRKLFEAVPLQDVRQLRRDEVRGDDHGWINLGVTGTKP